MNRPSPRDEPRLPWPDRLVEAGAHALLVFTPLAFGAVQPWAQAVVALVVLAMAAVWVLGSVRHWELRVTLPPGSLPAALFLGLVWAQTVPLPGTLVETLSPRAAAAHREAGALAGEVGRAWPLSLDPHATEQGLLAMATVAALFVVLHSTVRTRAQAERLVWTMVGTGTLVALLAIVQRATWNGRLYWVGPAVPASAFGPFVNRTHFTALMIVVVPFALALALARRRSRRRRSLRRGLDRLRAWVASTESGPTRLVAFLVLVIGGAAMVSGSRGGLVSLALALVVMIGLGSQGSAGRSLAGRIALAALLAALAAVWIGGDVLSSTLERLAAEVGRPETSVRLQVWRDALALWRGAPALGTGLGSFEAAFAEVRTLPMPVTFTHAESDWVQLLTDTGAVGLGLALATGASLGLALLRRLRASRSPAGRTLALAGLVALVGMATQGLANYNLPVLALHVYLVTAMVVALQPPNERATA